MNLYSLNDPRTGELRYIGKTKHSLDRRLRQHLKEPQNASHKSRWIAALRETGMLPVIEELDTVSGDGNEEEIAMIGIARSLGARLTNVSAGGEGVTSPTQEFRDRVAAKTRAQWADPELRERIARSIRGRKHSPEAVERNRAGQVKRFASPEAREKMAAQARAMWADPETRERLVNARLGRKASAETRAKMRATRLRKSAPKGRR